MSRWLYLPPRTRTCGDTDLINTFDEQMESKSSYMFFFRSDRVLRWEFVKEEGSTRGVRDAFGYAHRKRGTGSLQECGATDVADPCDPPVRFGV